MNQNTPGVHYATLNDIPLSPQPKVVVDVDLSPVAVSGSYNDLSDKPDVYTKQEVDDIIDDLQYTPISISAFSSNPSSAEQGSTVSSVTLSYTLSKVAASAMLDGSARTLPGKSGTVPNPTGLPRSTNKTWTLSVTDTGSSGQAPHTATKNASLTFMWKRYWGAVAIPADIGDAFLLGLPSKELATGRGKTFTVNAGAGQYIWYAIPTSWGACTFKVGGFDGGFQIAATFQHTNASGGKTEYRVYRSDNASLGSTTVTVS